ncbi:MAG: hypothetical protein JXD23_11010 [Spirochaetales bacterium]|nr:hypothetical protein [Spirochaetales bacterium]
MSAFIAGVIFQVQSAIIVVPWDDIVNIKKAVPAGSPASVIIIDPGFVPSTVAKLPPHAVNPSVGHGTPFFVAVNVLVPGGKEREIPVVLPCMLRLNPKMILSLTSIANPSFMFSPLNSILVDETYVNGSGPPMAQL